MNQAGLLRSKGLTQQCVCAGGRCVHNHRSKCRECCQKLPLRDGAEGVSRSSHYAPGPKMMPPWPCFSPQHLPVSDILYILLISLLSLSTRCFMRMVSCFCSLQIPSTRMVTGTEEMLLDDLSNE